MKDQIKRMITNLEILHSALSTIPGITVHKALGGPTMFPDISQTERSSMKLAHYLLERAGVLVAPGVFYLSDGHVRTSFWGSGSLLTESDMQEASSKLRDVIPKYVGSEYHISV